jgi:hypothetical protein
MASSGIRRSTRIAEMHMKAINLGLAAAILGAALVAPLAANAGDKAPMPQTKGMQGMDPAAHDKWAKEGEQDLHKDCKPNARKAATAEKHPMPDTKGMKGMDPKAHEMDCPEGQVTKPDPSKHVHKTGVVN